MRPLGLITAFSLALVSASFAQSVQQSGVITPGHAACWAITGVIYDCGAPGGGISVVGSQTQGDFPAFNGSGSLIDSGINPAATSNWSGLQNFNGGITVSSVNGITTTGTPLPGYVPIATSSTAAAWANPFTNSITQTLSGSTLSQHLSAWNITDSMDASAPVFSVDRFTHHDFGSQGGGRTIQFDFLIQTAPSSEGVPNFYVGGTSITQTNTGDGGTGLSPSLSRGFYYARNDIVHCGGANISACFVAEDDLMTSANFTGGLTLAHSIWNFESVQGVLDAGLAFLSGAQIGAGDGGGPWGPGIGFHNGILFAELNGSGLTPLDSTATVLGTSWSSIPAPTVAVGIDFGNGTTTGFNFTTGAFRSKSFLVDGSGNVAGNSLISNSGSATLGSNTTAPGQLAVASAAGGGAFALVKNPGTTVQYNFNLPATAGTSGYVLLSGGGDAAPMTWSNSLTAFTLAGLTTFSGQMISTFGATSIASGACGATTNGTVAGTNASGLITIGSASTTTCTISFSTTITAPNACLVFPANATAAAQGTTVARVSSVGTTNFVVTGSALASSNYYYICL